MATVRTAIYPNGDTLGGWKFLTETAGLTVQPAARGTETRTGDARHAASQPPDGQPPDGHLPASHLPDGQAPDARPGGGAAADGRAADGRAQVPQHS